MAVRSGKPDDGCRRAHWPAQFVNQYLPLELEFHDSQSTLIIMAAE
ncbi:MAG: hypothetical protein OJF47_003842 [Nitrospira sp.]|nr:MAG: hypothetical protein OJF47_003842 [Nitrospira sp.]